MEILLVPIVLGVGLTGVWVWALISAVTTPDGQFHVGNKPMWAIVIVVAGWVGAIVYLLVGRPRQAHRGPIDHQAASDGSVGDRFD